MRRISGYPKEVRDRLSVLIIAGIFLLVFLGLKGSANIGEVDEAKPFKIGERLIFELTWFGIKAGWATLEVKEKVNYDGREIIRIISTAQSNKFVSVFYPVDDRTETFLDPLEKHPHRFIIKQREGNYRSDKEIVFDQEMAKAVFIKDGKSQTFKVSPKVQDALSSFYYLRTLDLKVGNTVYIKIFDNGKNYDAEVQVLRKERIDTPAGSFNTICVKPRLQTEGIFQRKGDIYIWLTDDDRKMPVMMRSSVKIGPVKATLIQT
ncbi:MAG: DUF3108 domain-containing protein [Nitrospirae bacterium]|nr:DUF3108 domain-containing protein [Nitrospirota bacterium]